MTFRTRILLAALIAAIAPLTIFAFGARQQVREELRAQSERRMAASSRLIRADLAQLTSTLDARLRALADRARDSPQERLGLLGLSDRTELLDYASSVMGSIGFDYLLLLGEDGTVLSSGHYRNDYDRSFTAMLALRAAEQPVLIQARRPQGVFRALVRAHTFQLGDRSFVLAGGVEADSTTLRNLAPDESVTLTLDDSTAGNGTHEEIALAYIDEVNGAGEARPAHLTITQSFADLQAAQRELDMWLLAAALAAIVLAAVIARVLAARVTRPLEELAAQTTRVHLDRKDVSFALDREDEVGSLSQLLDGMIARLRKNAQDLRVAERRATVGDMARQVNHDIRNGLLPIRNVISHLSEVAHKQPGELPAVFVEREGTLQGGIGYLENLATNYARLSPRTERQLCDVNAIIRTALHDIAVPSGIALELELSPAAPRVAADPVALRRIIENLTINAIESMANAKGQVKVKTDVVDGEGGRRIQLSVIDTGVGIPTDQIERIFDDFYSTKERGSGLGLSIVRRLVADMSGRIRVASKPGSGTHFLIELPEAS
jgi:signal transduction histidine kinase